LFDLQRAVNVRCLCNVDKKKARMRAGQGDSSKESGHCRA
jgi:hypothetical protein